MPFQPGQSGNPRGRPRVGESLAYLLREKFPPERVAAELERILGDPEATPAHRLAALQLVGDRAYGKPPAEIALPAGRPPARLGRDDAGSSPALPCRRVPRPDGR
jgi:hypothetical protein